MNIKLIKQMIEEDYVSKRKHPECDLYILNYTPKCQINWKWNEATMTCRGLIVDAYWNVVARPFKKFFTYEQWKDLYTRFHSAAGGCTELLCLVWCSLGYWFASSSN